MARPKVYPCLWFDGKAEEAVNFYTSVFADSSIGPVDRYGPGEEPDREGAVRHVTFTLEGHQFAAMDSAHRHEFALNEAISLMIDCNTQQEIDYYWNSLTAVPESEQCGWLKDKFGLSWQVVPRALEKLLSGPDEAKKGRVMAALFQMKKLDLATLEAAGRG